MSNAPFLLPGARAVCAWATPNCSSSMVHDGLWDVYNDKHMGSCAELCASKYNFSRESQDQFAMTSYRRAHDATKNGAFDDEITSVEITGRKGDVTVVSEDEEPKRVNFDKVASLRPAFGKEGSITAANASSINDGAAAVVVCTEETAKARGMPILGKITGYSANAIEPEWFTVAPVGAMKKLYDQTGTKPEDYDLYEVNEAFSVVSMAAMEEFGVDHDNLNVHGGAVALGHPIGTSGTRIVVTLLPPPSNSATSRPVSPGPICIGGGGASRWRSSGSKRFLRQTDHRRTDHNRRGRVYVARLFLMMSGDVAPSLDR
ncbi:MAG: thiolase family protein [Trueperaceae bacterium]|nr:thiolase family protein [Trueperaceae bacterium]